MSEYTRHLHAQVAGQSLWEGVIAFRVVSSLSFYRQVSEVPTKGKCCGRIECSAKN